MPTYDYKCDANGQVVEVMHRMNDVGKTWGELCEKTGRELGGTPAETPVVRMATGGNVINSSSAGGDFAAPDCATGSCCPGGMCGLN